MNADEVKNMGRLSRIKLSEDECATLAGEFDHILEHIQKLNELDVDGIEPVSHPFNLKNVFRKDEVRPSLGADTLMKIAPQSKGDMIRVPKVIEEKK
ncbi:MAG: aspartyl-tRNA(Asn)/glutamyl-tRNA(Gln) amidotransferase subunit C [Candidatus Omnitrophota bacterium]|jgi:aspartyl-tRNA(Asn)/glutamyl-tRNA(Gln) amidotransferase subunit C